MSEPSLDKLWHLTVDRRYAAVSIEGACGGDSNPPSRQRLAYYRSLEAAKWNSLRQSPCATLF